MITSAPEIKRLDVRGGRWALRWRPEQNWTLYEEGSPVGRLAGDDLVGDWRPVLLVTLPPADHNGEGVNAHGEDTITDQWEVSSLGNVDGVITAWTNGIEIEGTFYDADDEGDVISKMEADAVRLLAAVQEHRRLRAR